MPESSLHPAYSDAAARAVAGFPVTVDRIEAVSIAENLTFRVTDTDGQCFALRLHRPGYNSLDELESERLWVAALAATEDWAPPPGFTRPRLDRDGLVGEAPRWGRFWEHRDLAPESRRYLESLREPLGDRLDRYGANASNFSLIHADLHAGNLLVTDSGLGVIDFDDAAWGWHMYDLATALVEYRDAEDFAALRDAMLAGYREHRRLGDADLAMLPVFLLLRQLALIGWLHERPEYRGDPYLEDVLQWALADAQALFS